jgi:hypothetical protein
MRRFEEISGFFQRFTRHGSDQRLTLFKVASRLVEGKTGLGFFLNQQEFAIALNDGGDGDIGFPDHGAHSTAKPLFYPLISARIVRFDTRNTEK